MTLRIRLLETETTAEYTVPDHSVIRLPVAGIAHRALGCEAAESSIVFDDPGGGFSRDDMDDFRGFVVEETACSEPVIFAGVTTKKTLTRGTAGASPSLVTGADRIWSTGLVDDNWQSFRRVIHNSDGNRPAETDVERMQWYIDSPYSFHIDDVGLVDTSNPVDMDPADYVGKYGIDVINDCMKMSGKNCFMYPLQDGSDHHGIAYFLATSTTYSSTLSISNDPADFADPLDFTDSDSWTVFPCGRDASLDIDPMRKYGGGLLRYAGGIVYVNPGGGPSIRDFSVDEPMVKTQTAALALANKYLDVSSFPEDIINVSAVVPASLVNKILAGMRIQVKLIDLEGYESFTWRRIANRGVSQYNNRRDLYQLNLELRDPRLVGGIGTGAITVPAGTTNGQQPPVGGTSDTTILTCADKPATPVATHDIVVTAGDPSPADFLNGWQTTAYHPTPGRWLTAEVIEDASAQATVDGASLGLAPTSSYVHDGSANDWCCNLGPSDGGTLLYWQFDGTASGNFPITGREFCLLSWDDTVTDQWHPWPADGTLVSNGAFGSGRDAAFGLVASGHGGPPWTFTVRIREYSNTVAVPAPPPAPGQPALAETITSDGTTGPYQTNYPYAPGSLTLDGGLIGITETDPATGSFTTDTAYPAGTVFLVQYLGSGGDATGATNPAPSGDTLLPYAVLGTGGDGSGDNVLHDDGTWQPQAAVPTLASDLVTRYEPHVAYDGTVVLDGSGDPVMVEVAN